MADRQGPFESADDEGAGPQRRRPDRPDLLTYLATIPTGTPTGLVLVGWDPPPTADQDLTHTSIEQVIAFVLAACADRDDTLVSVGPRQVAVVRELLDAPAATEGLAHRIAHRLDIELARLATQTGDTVVRWAIGVAVGTRPAPARDLARQAERAVDDAWLLGGGQVVVNDRDPLLPLSSPRYGGSTSRPPGS